jgi:hypothetical protein
MAEYPTLRNGDEAVDGWVEYMQELLGFMLATHGSSTDVEKTGRFTDATELAVKEYQGLAHLTVDGVVGDQTWASLRGEQAQGVGGDGRAHHSFVQQGPHATIYRERAFGYSQDRAPQKDGLVLYCANTGSTTFTANEHSASCTLSGHASHECQLALVPDGNDTPPGETFWFENTDLTLEAGRYDYRVELPSALGGETMDGSFTVE